MNTILISVDESNVAISIPFSEYIINALMAAKVVKVERSWYGHIKNIVESDSVKTVNIIDSERIKDLESSSDFKLKKLEAVKASMEKEIEEISAEISQIRNS